MNISRDNWDIYEIESEEYSVLSRNLYTINRRSYYPAQYFLFNESHTKFKMLIEQTCIGLPIVPYISFIDRRQTLLCLTDCCIVFDYAKQNILLQRKLSSACVEIVFINDFVYIVCEAEILEYSVNDNMWVGSLNLSDSVRELFKKDEGWFVILYNGETIKLPY